MGMDLPTKTDSDGTISLDLKNTSIIRKVVTALVICNAHIDIEQNALALSQGVGPYAPIIESLQPSRVVE
jgi:hypothetical protein